ncbi:MAG: hypothetical protein WA254_09780 [Candidatus Sulfotelmatobacter sp.]
MGRDSLVARKKAQLEAAKQFKVFHQFQFTDNALKIDQVEVDWPSRRKQVLTTGIEENQTLRITEPK